MAKSILLASAGPSDHGMAATTAAVRETKHKVLVRADGATAEHVVEASADSPLASFDIFAPDIINTTRSSSGPWTRTASRVSESPTARPGAQSLGQG